MALKMDRNAIVDENSGVFSNICRLDGALSQSERAWSINLKTQQQLSWELKWP